MLYLITGTLGTGKTSMVVDMILNNKDGLFKMEAEDGTKNRSSALFLSYRRSG